MRDPGQEHLMGRIAVHLKMITMDQLAEATREQGPGGGKPIGAIFVEKGWINQAQLEKLIQYQKDYLARRQETGADGQAARPGTGPAAAARAGAPKPATPIPAAAKPATLKPAAPKPAAPGAKSAAEARPAARRSGRLDALLTRAVGSKASDLHLHSGSPVKLRLHGELVDLDGAPLAAAEAEALVAECLTSEQKELFRKQGEIDFAYTLPGVGRFRASVYRQQRGVDGVFRVIPPSPPKLEDLGLPISLAKVVNFHQGLVLLTGPGGCGKSSTLAALVNILNEERRDHILTIEDPIEHLHPSNRCIVNQRQVSRHTESFARALRAALREDPDVIVIGELRDKETISLALTAAETGHLVLGTLHTNNAIRTINRVLGVFPPSQQSQIRVMISESLKAIVSQRLLPRADRKGRVAALEILMCNRAVGNLIREGKTFQILSVLQTGAPHGMCLMESSLAALLKSGAISKDEALRHVEDPKRLVA
jgi:twitching motility protein PilT